MNTVEFFLGPVLKGGKHLSADELVGLIVSRILPSSKLSFIWGEPLSLEGFVYALLSDLGEYHWSLRSSFAHWDNFAALRANPVPENCDKIIMRFSSPHEGGWGGEIAFANRVRDLYRAGYPLALESKTRFTYRTMRKLGKFEVGVEDLRVGEPHPVEDARTLGRGAYRSKKKTSCPSDLQVIGPDGRFFPCPMTCLFGLYSYGSLRDSEFTRERQEECELVCPFWLGLGGDNGGNNSSGSN